MARLTVLIKQAQLSLLLARCKSHIAPSLAFHDAGVILSLPLSGLNVISLK